MGAQLFYGHGWYEDALIGEMHTSSISLFLL